MTGKKRKVQPICAPNDAMSMTLTKSFQVRRNDPCPCGSGKKAKNCCGAHREYAFRKFRPVVKPACKIRKELPWPFHVGEVLLTNAIFPIASLVGKKVVVTECGFEETIASFYNRIRMAQPEDDPNHELIDTWYVDGCFERVIDNDKI